MIYDRTADDVWQSEKIIGIKVKSFLSLTDEEKAILQKGTITIDTLNRIENKQNELATVLKEMGYYFTPITNKSWTIDDVFKITDFQRIIENNHILQTAFYLFSTTETDFRPQYDYKQLNIIEKMLYDLEVMIEFAKSWTPECGDFECGERA